MPLRVLKRRLGSYEIVAIFEPLQSGERFHRDQSSYGLSAAREHDLFPSERDAVDYVTAVFPQICCSDRSVLFVHTIHNVQHGCRSRQGKPEGRRRVEQAAGRLVC
jgi:hypothetical protein